MLKDKIKLKMGFDEYLQLSWILQEGIILLRFADKADREKVMIMASVNEVYIKMQKQLIQPKDKYTLILSLTQAQAIWLAYEHGYIYAMAGVPYAQLVLKTQCNRIHQQTA